MALLRDKGRMSTTLRENLLLIIVDLRRFLVGEEGARMDRSGGESRAQASSIRRVGIAGFVGTTLEWYDYFL